MTRPFVLLSTQRSGSTWVIDMLNSHPRIVTYGELLLQNGRGRPPFGAQDLMFLESFCIEKKLQPENGCGKELLSQYLNNVFATKSGVSAAGFKMMYGQYGAYPHLHDFMLSNNMYIAHLIRRNYLDLIISKKVAAARDVYHVNVVDMAPTPTIRLNTSRLLDQLAQHEKMIRGKRKYFSQLGLPYIEIFYEDLQSDQSNFDMILRFLNIEAFGRELTSQLRKIVKVEHSEIIENYLQAKQLLAGTRFSNLLK